MTDTEQQTILVVDDVAENVAHMSDILDDVYRVIFAMNGADALAVAQAQPQPDLVILDVLMPGMDGYEVCRQLKADLRTRRIPVIFVTSQSDAANEERGLKLGAADYLHKPCHPSIVRQRVRTQLDLHNQNMALERRVRERTAELERTRLEAVQQLARAGQYRDNHTGRHVMRMCDYCRMLALAAGIPTATADLLLVAASMHDIGNIGIPDHILLKQGKLDESEQTVMQLHTLIGPAIIGVDGSDLMALARSIALTHHERWDGGGYPKGLLGTRIPIEGRIVAICDTFETLTSGGSNRRVWKVEDALDYIAREAGKAFDPELVDRFVSSLPQIQAIREQYAAAPADEDA